ncbi:MAG: glycosyltransferase family 4 protein [Candidatus Thorarchaeota archaeon]
MEHFPPYLGSDRTIFEISQQLAKKGLDVHFIATQPLRYLLGQRPKKWRYKKNWAGQPPQIHQNITARYLLLPQLIESLWKRFMPLAYLITLILFSLHAVREIVQKRPDVILTANASPILGIVSILTAKITRTPNVMGCPDWITAYAASLANDIPRFGLVLLQIIEQILYRISSRVVAVTHYLQKILIRVGVPHNKIAVIPNGVDTNLFTPTIDTTAIRKRYRLENSVVVLFSGHLEDWAGLTLLVDLARNLDDQYPSSVILLVGAGASLTQLFENLSRENLGHMITYAGMHPYYEMPKFTAAADVALCVFPDTPVSHAASPLKLFEYMSAGRAVVATRVAGTVEVLQEENGVLVPPDDSDSICEAVVDLCKNEDKRKKLGENARNSVVKHYSWEQLATRYLRELEIAIQDW